MSYDISPKTKEYSNQEFRSWMTLDVPVGALVLPPQSTLQHLEKLGTSFYSFLQNTGYKFDSKGVTLEFSRDDNGVDILFFDSENEVAVINSYTQAGDKTTTICRLNPGYRQTLESDFKKVGANVMPKFDLSATKEENTPKQLIFIK